MHEPKNEWKLIHFAVFLAKMPSEVLGERKNDFWDFLNHPIGTTERATRKTITSSERRRNGLSNDAIFFTKIFIFTGCKKSLKKAEFSGFRKRISFINRRCTAVNGPTVVVFILMKSQFDVLSTDIEIAKKIRIFSTKWEKNLKIGFIDNFTRFIRNTQRMFSALRAYSTNNKRHVLRKFFKKFRRKFCEKRFF